MTLSAKTEYALLALAAIARAYGSENPIVQIPAIASEYGVPGRFLVQILIQLKGGGVVDSTRGAAGGYRLLRDPRKLTVLDVVEMIDGPDEIDTHAKASSPASTTILGVFTKASVQRRAVLKKTTIAQLAGIGGKK